MTAGLYQRQIQDVAVGKNAKLLEVLTVRDLNLGQDWQIRHASRLYWRGQEQEQEDRESSTHDG